jgi:transketolase
MAKAQGLTWTVEDADQMTQAEIYGEVITQLALKDKRIVALTADLARSTKIGKFEEKIPERFFNFGIAEANMFAVAAGMEDAGLIPIVSTFAVFSSLRAAEFVRTDICYQKRNVKIIATHSGTSFGQAGTTHHCTEDLAVMRALANMVVIAPADALETARAAEAALLHDGPVYMRIGRGFEPPLHKDLDFDFQIGKAIQLREGTDLTVIASGIPVRHAVEASDLARQQGLGVRVIDMHTLKPLDEEAVLAAVRDTRRIITVEDHSVIGGLGTAVAEVIAGSGKGCAFRRLGYQDCYAIVGYPDDLLHHYCLDADGILAAIGEVLKADFEADEDWADED